MAPMTGSSTKDTTVLEKSEKQETARRGTVKRDIFDLICRPVLRPIVTSCSFDVRAPQIEGSNHTGESSSGVTSDDDTCDSNECTTPKAKEFRIPESLPCPPAPKKRRVASRHRLVSSTEFFSPPDLELFFPSRKISVKM